jgi:hypothetical protein
MSHRGDRDGLNQAGMSQRLNPRPVAHAAAITLGRSAGGAVSHASLAISDSKRSMSLRITSKLARQNGGV